MKAKHHLAGLLLAGALLAPATAQAHISLHPNTIPAGAFATLDVRVPGEQEGAYVKRVDVLFPAGFTGDALPVRQLPASQRARLRGASGGRRGADRGDPQRTRPRTICQAR